MTTQTDKEKKVLDELIDNAVLLSPESQNLILMMARAMQYTRNCITRQGTGGQPRKYPRQTAGS